jgi:hypothetical protein
MQTKKILTLTIFLIIFLTISLFGCAPKSSELEKTVMQLQDEIAKKEQVIKDLQEKNIETTVETTAPVLTKTMKLSALDASYENDLISINEYIDGLVELDQTGPDADRALHALADAYTREEIDVSYYMECCDRLDLSLDQRKSVIDNIIDPMFEDAELKAELEKAKKAYEDAMHGSN